MQQYLPFTVLKQQLLKTLMLKKKTVATVPTVYGIETLHQSQKAFLSLQVATVPTVYGIETTCHLKADGSKEYRCNSTYRLRY